MHSYSNRPRGCRPGIRLSLWAVTTLLFLSGLLLAPHPARAGEPTPTIGATVEFFTITQPVDHDNPTGPTFEEEIYVLIPDGADLDSPVFFILGYEDDLDQAYLIRHYEKYGLPGDVIFITVEHRGYGQSLTDDPDQSIPTYVSIPQALADYHRAVEILKETYTGPWMGVGYSYGGALAINFAYLYPEDVELILSSSGVVDWPFLAYGYEDQVRANFGDRLYGRIVKHVNNLEPEEVFDETWQEREFLLALVSGLAQLQQFEKYLPLFKALSMLPTPLFLKAMHFIDDNMALGAAWEYAYSRSSLTLSRDEAATGRYSWRVYMYQQCTEFFDFWMSKEEGGLYTRSVEDYCEECETMFGEDLLENSRDQWMVRDMVPELMVPMVYVNGGLDPWGDLCLEPDYPLENGVYLYYPDKKHCPDNKDAEIGAHVLSVMLGLLEE